MWGKCSDSNVSGFLGRSSTAKQASVMDAYQYCSQYHTAYGKSLMGAISAPEDIMSNYTASLKKKQNIWINMISVASDVYIFLELAISKDTMRFRHVRRVVSACVRYYLCVSWPWASGFWGQISDKIMAHQWIQTDDILWIGWRENLENLGIFTYYIFFWDY